MDAHSNPRRALKSAQEQEDRRRRRNKRDRARRAAETVEQMSERLRKRRERDCARRAAQTASERQATSQQRSPRERERMAAGNPERFNIVLCREQNMLSQLPLFQQCSIQSQDVVQTCLHCTHQHAQLVQKDFLALFHPSLMNLCILIWRVVI